MSAGNVVQIVAFEGDPEAQSAPAFPFRAVEDIVIIERHEREKSLGGIIIADTDVGKYPCGRVVACGPGRTYAWYMDASGNTLAGQQVPMQIKVGDWVVFGRYNSGGEPIEVDGKKYLMCRQNDIGLVALDGEPEVRLCPQQ